MQLLIIYSYHISFHFMLIRLCFQMQLGLNFGAAAPGADRKLCPSHTTSGRNPLLALKTKKSVDDAAKRKYELRKDTEWMASGIRLIHQPVSFPSESMHTYACTYMQTHMHAHKCTHPHTCTPTHADKGMHTHKQKIGFARKTLVIQNDLLTESTDISDLLG